MTETNAGRIIRLEIDNVKRLKAVRVTPEGALVVVAGKNDQGKSSVLDAIRFALGGPTAMKDTPEVVRRGEIAAKVVAEFDDLIVTRTVLDGKQAVVVESKDGARYKSPQLMLDSLVGSLSFDPLAFSRRKPAEQRQLLLELAGLDFTTLDGRRQRVYEDRTVLGRERDRIKGKLDSYPMDVRNVEPSEERSVSEVVAELEAARNANMRRSEVQLIMSQRRAEIEDIDRRIMALREQRATKLAEGNAAYEELQTLPEKPIDLAPLMAAVEQIEERNAQSRLIREYHDVGREFQQAVTNVDAATKIIAEIDAEKERMVREAALPVQGLGVDDDGVTFDGIPLSQASESQRLKTSVAIQMALNPSIRVMLIDNGNALDADNLALLQQMAEEHDYQIWMTWVGDSERAQVIIEDGEARG
jgi:hypothetical protein